LAITAVAVEDFDAETNLDNLKLLVAEDNPMNRRVVELLLAQSGVSITFAEKWQGSGQKFKAAKFDLVLMDLQMPIMGGLAAMRVIRELEKQEGRIPTPMLAVSANATDEHVTEAKEAGRRLPRRQADCGGDAVRGDGAPCATDAEWRRP